MINEEYKYVGHKYSLTTIPKIAVIGSFGLRGKGELYQSIYRFNSDIADYKSLGNLKSGITFYADYIVFDIDSEKLQKAYEDMVCLTDHLDMIEASYETWFSGSKGFHVMVPTCQFGFEPTNDSGILKNIALECARKWEISIDTKIYNSTRVLRMPGSLNLKSGLFKVPVKPSMQMDEILELAKSPKENPYPDSDDYTKNDILTAVYHRVINEPKVNRVVMPVEDPKKGRSLFTRVSEGGRNEAAYKIARGLARRGIVESDALVICRAWSNDLDKPMDEIELQKTVISAYTKGINELVDESNYGNHFYDVKRSLGSVKRLVSNLNNTIIRTGFKFIDNYTMGLWRGDMIFIFARPGNFKTAVLSSILKNIAMTTKKKALFFSMEMSPDRLNMRHMQSAEGMDQRQVLKAIKSGHKFENYIKEFEHVVVIGLSSLTIEMVLGMIDWYLENHGDIGAIGFDYLSLFRGCANNTEKTAVVATELKTRVAKAANCPTFCLVQAKREYQGTKGNVETDLQAGKDSSSIEDSGDYVIGLWRHGTERYGAFHKSRAFNSQDFEENPYFKLNMDKEYMRINSFEYLDEFNVPTFDQVQRGRH